MAMTASEIEELIIKAFPKAKVTIDDLRGDGDHSFHLLNTMMQTEH